MRAIRHILVVEDNEDDAFFMKRALRTAAPAATCDFVADGQAALDYLRGNGSFLHRAGGTPPDVVFLDLKLPYLHGLDVLAAVRSAPPLTSLSVIILTSSGEERDRNAAAKLGVEAYLVKPPTARMVADALGKLSPNRSEVNATPGNRPASSPSADTA